MKTGIYTLFAILFSVAGLAQAEVRVMSRLKEPMLFESNIVSVDNSCKQSIRNQIFQYLDANKAVYSTFNDGSSYSSNCDRTAFESCLYSSNITVYKVEKSLFYKGSSFVVDIDKMDRFSFAQYPNLPYYDSLLADLDSKCRISNVRLAHPWGGSAGD